MFGRNYIIFTKRFQGLKQSSIVLKSGTKVKRYFSKKNPAFGRHLISRFVRIVASIPKKHKLIWVGVSLERTMGSNWVHPNKDGCTKFLPLVLWSMRGLGSNNVSGVGQGVSLECTRGQNGVHPHKDCCLDALNFDPWCFDHWETWDMIMWPVLANERPQNKLYGEGTTYNSISTDITTTRLNRLRGRFSEKNSSLTLSFQKLYNKRKSDFPL